MDDQKHSFYLPPGFRFHPTDDEIITHYLAKKITDHNFCTLAVGLANFNDCEPWDLPGKAKMGDKEWYFFCQKDRKYPTGMRTNRATRAGYWKTTGKDKEIFKGKDVLIGKKKTLVFYMGRAPRGHRTNWVMHEYRHEGRQEEWVVCKLYHKTKDSKISPLQTLMESKKNSFVNNMFVANPNPPPILNSPSFNSTNPGAVIRPQELEDKSSLGFSFGPNWFLRHEEERLRAANSIASTSHDTGLSTERNVEASSSPISILAGAGYGF